MILEETLRNADMRLSTDTELIEITKSFIFRDKQFNWGSYAYKALTDTKNKWVGLFKYNDCNDEEIKKNDAIIINANIASHMYEYADVIDKCLNRNMEIPKHIAILLPEDKGE